MIEPLQYTQNDIAYIALVESDVHPKARLLDYYKLFFQAYWGQGHFIIDTQSVYDFLDNEMSQMQEIYLPIIQDISNGNGLYRISVSAIAEGLINREEFLRLFLARTQIQNSWDCWTAQWQVIQTYLTKTYPNITIPDEINDCLDALKNRKLVSHSKYFQLTYKPHYRVMQLTKEDLYEFPKLKEYL